MDFTIHGNADKKIILMVRTGGPCSGKTAIGPWLNQRLLSMGWRGYDVREAARSLIEEFKLPVKAAWQNRDMKLWLECQRVIAEFHFEREIHMERIARIRGEFPALIHVDRGLWDNFGYILDACHYFGDPKEAFEMFVNVLWVATRLTPHQASMRYRAVVHFVTAADGAPHAYRCDDGGARDESPERAIELDQRMIEAWERHPQRYIIDNSTDFEGKKERVLQVICSALSIPEDTAKKK
jgi:hypothetical protein